MWNLDTTRPPRHLEWWLARFTCVYGLWVTFMPNAMTAAGYAVVLEWMSAGLWGLVAIFVGGVHISALMVNGRWIWTPIFRAVAAAFNAFFFAIIGTGFAKADASSIGVAIYLFGLSWAGLVVFASAWRDSVPLLCQSRKVKKSERS